METEILIIQKKHFVFCFGLKMPFLREDWCFQVFKRKTWEDEVVKIISFLMAILQPFSTSRKTLSFPCLQNSKIGKVV